MDRSSRHTYARIAGLIAGAALGMGMLACDAPSVTGEGGLTSAIGVPAQVVYVTNSIAGGQRLLDSLQIDSASGRWSQSQCGPVSATGATCDQRDVRTESGTMEPFLRMPLFERARRHDFQMLQREYRRSGDVPPDVVRHLLHIVQDGRRRTISWESGAPIPPAVESFLCRLRAARGAFILCAE